ncbi:MAG: phenylacetate--CoA ligase family protein, partial [Verrucomicrobia bacterium]|nr:phenylacetate--CoA ligase family protein [Verrucomicrobiota bacterium]
IERENANVKIRRFLYAGEPFFPAQRAYCQRRFPGIDFRSLGYASIDSGFIGAAETDAQPGEHRALDLGGIMEIHDEETGEPIEESGVPGKVIFTNLARRLMPIIRYPAGDVAQWLEPAGTPNRKFMLLGRSEEAARIAHENMHVADVRALLEPFTQDLDLVGFQLIVTTEPDRRDKLTIRLAARASREVRSQLEPKIHAAIETHKPRYNAMVRVGTAHPISLEWVKPDDLITNVRSGKVRMVVDQRGQAV